MLEFNALKKEQDSQIGQFLTFKLGNELFAVENSFVTEINHIVSITPLPDTPAYLKGIINLHGKIIPVIDMRLKLRKQPGACDNGTCIILNMAEARVGLFVDTVAEVLSIHADHIDVSPELKRMSHNHYLQGIGKNENDEIMILNCQKILAEDEIFDLAQIVS